MDGISYIDSTKGPVPVSSSLPLPVKVVTGAAGATTQRTASTTRATGVGSVAAGASSVSIANVGAADGVLLSNALKMGESITFAVNGNDTLGAITYDATGTEFLIGKVV